VGVLFGQLSTAFNSTYSLTFKSDINSKSRAREACAMDKKYPTLEK
jgi:hypothetical protein